MTRPPSQTEVKSERQATAPRAAELQTRVESRLATAEPDVEVLAVERAGSARSPVLRIFVDRPGEWISRFAPASRTICVTCSPTTASRFRHPARSGR